MGKIGEDMHHEADKQLFQFANDMRKNPTVAELKLWDVLRGRKFKNLKFRRQHPIANFIVDFYCHELLIAIEVDGEVHNLPNQKQYDHNRTYELEQLGLKVIRFSNDDVIFDMDNVLKAIDAFIQ